MPGGLKVTLLNDDLTPVAGAAVQFDAVVMAVAPWHPEVYLTRDTAHYNWTQTATDTTGTDGQAWSALRLGCVAGGGRVRIRIPARQIDTTLAFDVVPGAATGVRLAPADTAVFVNSTLKLRGGVVDQCGNTRTDANTISTDGFVSLQDPATLTFKGISVGLAHVVATASDGQADTATISVVPLATLAAFSEATPLRVVTMNLDGSGYRVVHSQATANYGVSWGPSGSVLHAAYGPTVLYGRLSATDTQGATTLLFPADVSPQQYPRLSADGQWVYYSRGSSFLEIWRSHPDGSAAARVGPAGVVNVFDIWPWPSPDGSRVVFSRANVLWLLTGFAGQVASLGVSCTTPAWSPDGTRLACLGANGSLIITQTDGTVYNSWPTQAGSSGLAWTPDSQHVIMARNDRLELVNVQTGAYLPIPGTFHWVHPSLKPYP